ncbi:MAG: hypothetical protein K6A92_06075 [Lachnospiraceae bacterium]|nr:hypothetical protein [Lachnospiraceae bacterium]
MADSYEPIGDQGDNWLIYNTGRNVSPNFNFMLRVEGLFDLPCRRIHNFTKANEYEYIQEGGLNDYVHMRRKPVSQPFTFQVERYVGVDYLDPLQPGTDLILPVVLMVWRMQMKGNFTPFRVYTFTGCTVMSKEYGELNAEQSGLLTETTTIGYRELMRMTMPDGMFTGALSKFEFNGTGLSSTDKQITSKIHGGTQHARHPANNDERDKGRLWMGSPPPIPLGTEKKLDDGRIMVNKTSAVLAANDKADPKIRPTVRKWIGPPEPVQPPADENNPSSDETATTPTSVRSAYHPANDTQRAEKVLWPGVKSGEKPQTLRAMMVQTLGTEVPEENTQGAAAGGGAT